MAVWVLPSPLEHTWFLEGSYMCSQWFSTLIVDINVGFEIFANLFTSNSSMVVSGSPKRW